MITECIRLVYRQMQRHARYAQQPWLLGVWGIVFCKHWIPAARCSCVAIATC